MKKQLVQRPVPNRISHKNIHHAPIYRLLGLCLSMVATAYSAVAANIDNFLPGVVLLEQSTPIMEMFDGVPSQLGLRGPNGDFHPKLRHTFGTGFLVAGKKLVFLVTAKHVATNITWSGQVTLRGAGDKPLSQPLGSFLGIIPALGVESLWRHHPDADCSVHPLGRPEVLSGIQYAIPFGIASLASNLPSRDSELAVAGFPFGMGIQVTFSPLSRHTRLSSGMLRDKEGEFFALEDPAVSGYSGAPVADLGDLRVVPLATNRIGTAWGGFKCFGIVSGTFNDDTGGKMARIVPIHFAVELIESIETHLAALPDLSMQPAEDRPSINGK